MMRLFSEKKITTIKQGKAGDCYLLVFLDCLMNTSQEGLEYIKSLFTETEAGVELRIKRSALSYHLVNKDLTKYNYYFDENTDQDVFTISHEKCREIDSSLDGVRTDSLAVKILERICAYYYFEKWQPIHTSLSVHSIRQMFCDERNRTPGLSLYFVAQLFSVEARKIEDVRHLIALKKIIPGLAVYLSLNEKNGRHSYGVHSIVLDGASGLERGLLINPWDNQNLTSCALMTLHARDPAFYFLKTESEKYELACILLSHPSVLLDFERILDKTNQLMRTADRDTIRAHYLGIQGELSRIYEKIVRIKHRILLSQFEVFKTNIKTHFKPYVTEVVDPISRALVELNAKNPGLTSPNTIFSSLNSAFQRSSSQLFIAFVTHLCVSYEDYSSSEAIYAHQKKLLMRLDGELNKNKNVLISTNMRRAYDNCRAKIEKMAGDAALGLSVESGNSQVVLKDPSL